jgi:hypothetical protein
MVILLKILNLSSESKIKNPKEDQIYIHLRIENRKIQHDLFRYYWVICILINRRIDRVVDFKL